jgi:hypothetical protein
VVEALESYSTRFWRRFRRDATPWARDNIVWGFVVLVAPPLAVYLHDPHAQIDWVLIRTTALLYLFAFMVYVLAHLARTPKKLDLERDARETALLGGISERNETIKERDETIRSLTTPRWSAAEEEYRNAAQKLIQQLGQNTVTALRHLVRHGSVTFRGPGSTSSPQLPTGMNASEAYGIYSACAGQNLVTYDEKHGSGERTFFVPQSMIKVLNELLYEDNGPSSPA